MGEKKEKGMWKRTLSLYTKFRIPFWLYFLQAGLGILSTKVALLYVPYETDVKLGNFDDVSVVYKYILLLLLSVLVSIAAAVPEFYAEAKVKLNLQNSLINHSLKLRAKSLENGASRMVSWITEDCTYANGLLTSIVGFITGIAATYMSVTSMSGIDRSLSYIIIIVVVYVFFSTWLEGKLMFLRERRGRRANAELTAHLAEHLGFFTEIKQLHTAGEETVRGKEAIRNFYRADVYQAVLTFINSFVSGSITNVITILIFVFGVSRVNSGAMTIEELAAFQSYVLIAYQSLSSLPGLYTNFMYYNGILYYISSMMAEPEEDDLKGRTEIQESADIMFKNVDFSYGSDPVLKDVTFTIPEGKTTLILGPNGSGKSTVLSLLERFYDVNGGSILYGGGNIRDFNLKVWRRHFGYVPQEPRLFEGSIRENITFGADRDIPDTSLDEAVKQAGAFGFINGLDKKYDFEIGENGGKLSGGQRQRIAIARALVVNAPYLLLDESTGSMDFYSARSVSEELTKQQGRTVVMITHDMNMLSLADHVIVLRDGTVEAEGDVEQVLDQSETLRQMTGEG